MLTAAEKKREQRRRQRAGQCVYRVVAPEIAIIEAILITGLLTDREALDRRQVERVLGEVLTQWAHGWRESAPQKMSLGDIFDGRAAV
jgi:hypothetical protein